MRKFSKIISLALAATVMTSLTLSTSAITFEDYAGDIDNRPEYEWNFTGVSQRRNETYTVTSDQDGAVAIIRKPDIIKRDMARTAFSGEEKVKVADITTAEGLKFAVGYVANDETRELVKGKTDDEIKDEA